MGPIDALHLTGAALDGPRAEVQAAVARYADAAREVPPFRPGVDMVPVAGRVLDAADLHALVDASLDGWLTEGRFAELFVEGLRRTTGRTEALLVGSGSQANLLAIFGLCSPLLDAPLRPGDEVITPAVGFATTVTPIYQAGLRPVYVDVEPDTLNPTTDAVEAAIGPRTRAIVAAHCLGNPFDAPAWAALAAEHDLVLIEDCCDAFGSTIAGAPVGTFGAASTYSFYPAHHMTTGEGGAVGVDDPTWIRALRSLREWGRDCWCPPGVNDACGHRFEGRYGELPEGYDHKYVFSQLGFNFKMTDLQAALGTTQLGKLDAFGAARRANFAHLDAALRPLADRLVLPRALPGADPSWFGYPVTLRDGGAAERRELQRFLLERRIDSRLLLGGNLTRQPALLGADHRIAGPLPHADRITEASIWVGVAPGLTTAMLDWVATSIGDWLGR
ncbi:MAG: lipopolysaccharide biosynthesis protein RfbH [Solirubrobacteraceae bacterium]|nr:lipopolysaccharide biosynthesis protein RfbH [Solirubrobacteraceae bacterium]